MTKTHEWLNTKYQSKVMSLWQLVRWNLAFYEPERGHMSSIRPCEWSSQLWNNMVIIFDRLLEKKRTRLVSKEEELLVGAGEIFAAGQKLWKSGTNRYCFPNCTWWQGRRSSINPWKLYFFGRIKIVPFVKKLYSASTRFMNSTNIPIKPCKPMWKFTTSMPKLVKFSSAWWKRPFLRTWM